MESASFDYYASPTAPSRPAPTGGRIAELPPGFAVSRKQGVPLWVWVVGVNVAAVAVIFVLVGVLTAGTRRSVEAAVAAPPAAGHRDAQLDVRNALTVEQVIYADTGAFGDDLLALDEVMPSLRWTDGVAEVGTISVAVAGDTVTLSTPSPDGVCWTLRAGGMLGASYASGTGACTAADPPGPFGPAWR